MAKKWMIKASVLLRLAIVSVLWIVAGGGGLRVEAESQGSPPSGQEVRIPISLGVDAQSIQQRETSSKDVQAAWDVWYEGIGKTYGISLTINVYEDLQALVQDFNMGRLDLAITTALNYLRMTPQIEPNRDSDIYGVIVNGKKTYQYLALTRLDAGVADITDVCGKACLIRADDAAGTLYLNTLLLKHGQPDLSACFEEVKESPSFSQVALGVFFKKGGVGVTTKSVFDTMVDLNPQLGKQLTILATSPELANGIFFFHKQVSPELKTLLLKHILNLQATSYGQQILLLYKIDDVAQFEPADLDSVKTLLQEYEQLKP
ncbi:ABC-type phosphate/phosphonate transport system periplasmic component-like protein [Candidatus Vecturithrix granuli]|uniref:ABC-type phosphate/phosphonate transport system periplasmic component-like protein n=1 Tax=Vecturithrix granuli TaxID=1499967 RepID=A0A081C7S2_VECG1|nr:ABC-type phosphate/phosphonate transport system periplasmic component-like protein [Candidatus Vecturithrix granuli]